MKLNLAFLGLLLSCLVGRAQAEFDAGNAAYSKGKYAEAILYYEKEKALVDVQLYLVSLFLSLQSNHI